MALDIKKVINRNFSDQQKVTLVEPYAGGAGASLKLLWMGEVDEIIINDFDDHINKFWRVVKKYPNFLINAVDKAKVDIDEWRKQKEIYKYSTSLKEVAFATLFLNRTNRSGIITGGPIGGTKQESQYKIDARFNKKDIIERLEKIKQIRHKITVYKCDGIKLLKKLEKRKDRENYFIFLDPPYHDKGSTLYFNHYKDQDHDDLRNFLKDTDLKWMMTYDNVEYIDNLYIKGFHKEEVIVNHSAYAHKKGKELLIFPAPSNA